MAKNASLREKRKVSIWLGLRKPDMTKVKTVDVLKDLCGVRYYDLDAPAVFWRACLAIRDRAGNRRQFLYGCTSIIGTFVWQEIIGAKSLRHQRTRVCDLKRDHCSQVPSFVIESESKRTQPGLYRSRLSEPEIRDTINLRPLILELVCHGEKADDDGQELKSRGVASRISLSESVVPVGKLSQKSPPRSLILNGGHEVRGGARGGLMTDMALWSAWNGCVYREPRLRLLM